MIPFHITSFDEVSSTMDVARDYSAKYEKSHGHLFTSVRQTGGRGRHARVWESKPGNLYASLILQPECSLAKASELSIVMAIALGEALLELLPPAAKLSYKWPNDILINNRKICGILLEAETQHDQSLRALIVGFGVNITVFPEEALWPATSLTIYDVNISPEKLLTVITKKVDFFYKNWTEQGLRQIRTLWLERAYGKDQQLTVNVGHEKITGKLKDLSAEGALMLDHEGQLITITSGEVYFKD